MTALLDRLPSPARSLIDRFLPQGAAILSILSFAYLVMGQVRNRMLATTFGVGPELDAYNAAFRIPEVALDILVASGLTAPFIPIFSRLRGDDERAANEFAQSVLTVAVIAMTAAAIGMFLFAPLITAEVGRGFDPATRAAYLDLFRINCLAQVLFAASICLGEVLVANRRFVFYALAPLLYQSGIVLGTLLLAGSVGIFAPAWGAVGGAVAHLAIRLTGTLRTSFRARPRLHVRAPAFREFIRLMLPRMLSYPIEPVMLTFFTALAINLGSANVSALNFASDYQVVPATLIGIPFSLAVFPALSAAFADGDRPRFRSIVVRNVVTIGALTLVAAVIIWIAAPLIITVLLRGGAFDERDAALTAGVLAAFALSVPFDSLSYPLSRALYATHNTVLQVIASFVGLGIVVVAALGLTPALGVVGIPFAYAAGMAVKVALLTVFLVPRVRRIGSDAHEPVSRDA
jgi:putative peptidoglycan lipid II flippase